MLTGGQDENTFTQEAPAMNHSLDDLAKGLASGTISRRKALRLMGGVLAGTVVASVPGIALTSRTAEAAGACRGHSACCTCTYADETGVAIGAFCFTMTPTRCSRRTVRRCERRCRERAPAGAVNNSANYSCEFSRRKRLVCGRNESGPTCAEREC